MTRRLVVTILSVSLTVLVLATGFRAWERKQALDAQAESLKANTAVRVSASCGAAVWQFDEQALDTILRSELLDPSLVSIRIFQNDTETLEWLSRSPDGSPIRTASVPQGAFDQRNFPIRYSSSPETTTTLATVSLWFDDGPLMRTFWADILWNVVTVFFIVASLTFALSWTVLRRLVRPLESIRSGMLEAAAATGSGLSALKIVDRLPVGSFPELERMARDLDGIFGQILEALNHRRLSEAKVQSVNDNLEALVSSRTEELAKTNQELHSALESLKKIQDELVHSAQLAVLGRLVASIAHEINTPLGAIVSSNSTINQELRRMSPEWLPFFAQLPESSRRVFQKLLAASAVRNLSFDHPDDRALRKHFAQVLAEEGLTDATNVADLLVETGFQGNDDAVREMAKIPEIEALLERASQVSTLATASRIVEVASVKVTKFVSALKTYARTDANSETENVDLAQSIETVLLLFQHEIKLGITVVRKFESVAPARCRPDGIQQVWTNLISNAFHAMGHQGTLTVGLRQIAGEVEVSLGDTGRGISPEIQSKIFSPFFTTKRPGEGTGLGLDIARRIVAECGGKITFVSKPGSTVFTVRLPAAEFLP